jgi:lysine-specific demethylase/histidyl-hydroxylase NO66
VTPLGTGAALGRCTGLDRDAFEASYWTQRPLLTHHEPGYADLLSAADIDELITSRGLRTPFFRTVQGGGTLTGQTRSVSAGGRTLTDIADADAIRESYAGGATLVLNALHRIHPALIAFCRALSEELGHATQCNAYVTPPGARGFAAHHDTHDVFVLQVDGHKRWNVYEPLLPLPLKSQPSSGLTDGEPLIPADTEPALSTILGPGDALYLPRGYIHAAETNDDRSIHLTIGVLATTAYDLLRDVLTLAANQPEFRRSLPLGSPANQLAPAADIVAAAARWLADLTPEQVQDAARSRVTSVAGPEPLGMLASEEALRRLDKTTEVRPRAGLTLELQDAADRTLLKLKDRELSLPAYVRPALEALLAGTCQVSELDLPVDDAMVLVRRLLREGVITRA